MKKYLFRIVFKTTTLGILAILSVQCASTNRDHIVLTNYADRNITPNTRTGQWLMTPLLIPTGMVTLTLDNAIVTPIVHTPSAYNDAREFIRSRQNLYFADLAFFPFQVLLSPVVFVGSLTGRSIFVIEPSPKALWGWPEWGRQWLRDENRRLIGPPEDQPDSGAQGERIQKPDREKPDMDGNPDHSENLNPTNNQ